MQVEGQHVGCLQPMMATGARVSNAYPTFPIVEDSPAKVGLILYVLRRGHLIWSKDLSLWGRLDTRYSPVRRSPSEVASNLHAAPRLACVKPVASVHPEPGSNSPLYKISLFHYRNLVCSERLSKSKKSNGSFHLTHVPMQYAPAHASCTTSVYVNLSKNSF